VQTNQPTVLQSESAGLAVVTPREEDAVGRTALRKASVRLLPLIGVGYGIAFMDRANISYAQLQMNRQLGFSATVFMLGAGLFFLSYAALEVPSNLLLMRFGARRWLARIMFTWGLLSMAMVLVRNAPEFYAMRLLLGAAEAGFFPGVIFYLMQWFPAGHRARAVSRFYIAYPLSSTLMGALAGWLMGLDGHWHLAGWQWMLVAEGLPAVLMSVAFLAGLPDGPDTAAWLTEPERAWILRRLTEDQRAAGVERHSAAAALREPRVWTMGFFNFCILLASYAYIFSAPPMVQMATGWTTANVGYALALISALGAVAMWLNGQHSDNTGERLWHMVVPLALMACGYVAAGFSARSVVVLPALGLMMTGFMAILGPIWTIPPQFLAGRGAAAGIATINTIGILGGFVGPYWMGHWKDVTGGFQFGMLTVTVPVLMAILLIWRIVRSVEHPGAPSADGLVR
jgi:MFS transporter, ACS family, tartrate transporter